MTLLVADTTKELIESVLVKRPHSLVLHGPDGVGLGEIAKDFAAKLTQSVDNVELIEPEDGLISIERIRQLYGETKSRRASAKVYVIIDADCMSADAQNALLKLFEEPVDNVHFVLTTHRLEKLLPTIRSRAFRLPVMPISQDASRTLAGQLCNDATRQGQILFLASGLPAEIYRLASDDDYFTKRSRVITDARTLLQAPLYDKLKIVERYSERHAALELAATTGQLLSFSLLKQRNTTVVHAMDAVNETLTSLRANGHSRTQLMWMVTKLT